MIGRGGIFAELRSQMLAAIPEGSTALFRSETTIGDWLANGAFVVTSCTTHEVKLQTSHVDFASAALVEIENLLNHCLEQLQELACFCADTRRRSDAWTAVTGYYLGFFAASALLRLIGRPVVFINRDQLRALQQLAGSSARPKQGAFQIVVGTQISATHREITVTPTDKVHEATWKSALGLLQDLRRSPTILKDPNEADFYDSLCTTAFCVTGVGFDWPSFVRNRANYRPGYAYKLNANTLEILRALGGWRSAPATDVFRVMREAYRRCSTDVSDSCNSVGMMMHVSFCLFLLVQALHRELVARRRLDRRWERHRNQFRQATTINQEFRVLEGD